VYEFELIGRFRDRAPELAAMQEWHDDGDPRALLLHGRRRVGKSWLFRAFAHGQEADIFVASTRALQDQLRGFAAGLERDGERPSLPDLEAFFRVLYRRARGTRRIAVVDELPNLIAVDRDLPGTLLKVMEEEASASSLRLILTGSHVSAMERLLQERQPLHDRLRSLRVRPLDFWSATEILGDGPTSRLLLSYALTGGVPKYLASVAGAADPVARLSGLALSPHGPLFEEARTVLSQELVEPATYFSLLSVLAKGPADHGTITAESRVPSGTVGRYLDTLKGLELVEQRFPVHDTEHRSHKRQYALSDGFLRFWFRYVFPFQADLEAGLPPSTIVEQEIRPTLAAHVSSTVEEVARGWVRRHGIGGATRVGAWWGNARHDLRRKKERSTEDIDIVGLRGRKATVVGEVRWRNQPMDANVLKQLEEYKLPAMEQDGIVVARPITVLVSRGGFSGSLREAAQRDTRIRLVEIDQLVASTPA